MSAEKDFSTLAQHFLLSTKKRFRYYKSLGDQVFEQLDENDFHFSQQPNSNNIAILIQHLHGNYKSRWTNFQTTDGEKKDRNRDQEFIDHNFTKKELLSLWEEGWDIFFQALELVNQDNILELIFIRSEEHSLVEAFQKQLAHTASHIGQMVFLAKIIKGEKFQHLSIPVGKSDSFFERISSERHNRFLVAVDFSETSKNALQYALDMAQHFNARIWVIHVIYPHLNPGASITNETMNNQVQQAQKQLEEFLGTFDYKDVRVQGEIEVGFVADQILEEEEKKKIDFLIIGNNGFGHGVAQAFGSTASELAFKSKTKVLLIPPQVRFEVPKLLVLANDQSLIQEEQIQKAIVFCKKINSKLELIHVESPESKSIFEIVLDTIILPIKLTLKRENENSLLSSLNKYAEEVNADWIVMIPREMSFWRKIMRPASSSEFICCTDRPLLVLR